MELYSFKKKEHELRMVAGVYIDHSVLWGYFDRSGAQS